MALVRREVGWAIKGAMGPLIALAVVALPGGIHGDLFLPDGGGRHAAVVLLHGGAGLTRRGSDFRAYGQDLAHRGFVVLLPHYFDATRSETMGPSTRVFDRNRSRGSAGDDAWQRTIAFLRVH